MAPRGKRKAPSAAAAAVKRPRGNQRRKPTVSLPSHWPVSTSKPSSYNSGNAFPPSACLQACAGTDIQVSRQASARPNLAKGKGRYLVLLPGLLSLKKPTKQDRVAESTSHQEEQPKDPQDTKSTDAPTKPAPTVLGRIQQLSTDRPVFSIPFPGEQRALTFQGQKVETSSKFMLLTCKKKGNKGTVVCKDVFSSVVVLGDASFQGDRPEPPEEATALSHYGGSNRSVVLGDRKPPAKTTTNGEAFIPLDHGNKDESDRYSTDEDIHNAVQAPLAPQRSLPKRGPSKKVEYVDSSDNSSDEEDREATSSGAATKAASQDVSGDESDDAFVDLADDGERVAKRPRQRRSTSGKVNYNDSLDESADEQSSSGESNSETNELGQDSNESQSESSASKDTAKANNRKPKAGRVAPKRTTTGRRQKPTQESDDSSIEIVSAETGRQPRDPEEIDMSNSSEEEFVPQKLQYRSTRRKSAPSRLLSKKRGKRKTDELDDEPNTTALGKASTARKRLCMEVQDSEQEGSEDVASSASDDKPSRVRGRHSPKAVVDTPTSLSETKSENELENSAQKKSPVKSSRRRRKSQSPAKKMTSPSKIVDLTNDDDFAFL